MRPSASLALTALAMVFAAACGTVTTQSDGSGQAGTSGQAGSGASGTTGQAGTTGSAGTTGQAGTTGVGGRGGTTGSGGTIGNAGTTGSAGTTGTAGRGGTTGTAGTTGSAGTTGNAGTTGAAGRGGTTGTAGRGGTTGNAGTTGAGGRGGTTGRGGQGGTSDGGLSCSELESEYVKAVQEARECTPNVAGQCQLLVDTGLACPLCQVRVTDTSKPDAIRTQWNKQGCTPPIFCPAIICIAPGPGMCTRSDSGGSGGMCTMQSGGIDPI